MPDESCRSCGGELVSHKLCSDCRKVTQKKCRICNSVTLLHSHLHYMNSLSNLQPQVVKVIQKNKPLKTRNSLHFSVLAISMVGFLILGLSASHPGIPQGIRDEAQATNLDNIAVKITDNFPAQYGKLYSNCIAYGSGGSITVTCPTDNGSVYREILIMTQDMKKEFSNSVFSIRGVSLMENSNGSVMLQYHLKKYMTTSFGT